MLSEQAQKHIGHQHYTSQLEGMWYRAFDHTIIA